MSNWADELEQLGMTSQVISGRADPSYVYGDPMPATKEFLQEATKLGWQGAKPSGFDLVDGYFVDKGSKLLYRRVPGNPLLGLDPATAVSVYFVDGDSMVCLTPAEPYNLSTLQERKARAEAEHVRDEAEAARAREQALDRQNQRTVTLADTQGRELPSLQAAARCIVEEFRGQIERDGDRLTIRVPAQLTGKPGSFDAGADEQGHRQRVADAALVLTAGREIVLEQLGRQRKLDPGRLPDAPLTADGGIAA